MNPSILTLSSLLLASATFAQAEEVRLTLRNTAPFPRVHEMVEIDAPAFFAKTGSPLFILRDSAGNEIPWQVTHDGKLIFQADVPTEGEALYVASEGIPSRFPQKVYGRLFRERADDFAWENEHAAYRAYGPALQKNGERAFGYDVWTKSVPDLILEKRFFLRDRQSIHKDHGDGMDVYTVGPTLGGGTAALRDPDGSILYPWAWNSYEILDNGPLRFTVRLTYPPMTAEKGIPAEETRVISIDAGDWFNKTSVCWKGLAKPTPLVAGQVVHRQNPDAWFADTENGFAGYADLTENADAGNGTIFVGSVALSDASPAYIPLSEPVGDAVGHIVLTAVAEDSIPFTYYWGSGWSKGGMPDMAAWKQTLLRKRQILDNPIQVTF